MPQEGKTTVKISGTHADTMISFIECNRWRDNKIEFLGRNKQASRWLPDSEAILFEFGFRGDFTKKHLCTAAQNRDENALICAPRALNDFACIYFVMHWQIRANQFA